MVLHRVVGPLRDLEIIGAFLMDKGFLPSLYASYVKNGSFIHDRKEMSSESKRLQGYNYTSLMLIKEAQHLSLIHI